MAEPKPKDPIASLVEDLDNFVINLPGKDDPNLMEDYRRRKSYEPPEDITPLIQQLEENRENYLNFDFNINDLKAYLFKHIIMRAERTLIQRALEEKKQQMGAMPMMPMPMPMGMGMGPMGINNFKPGNI